MTILKGADRRSESFCQKLLLVLHLINARLSPVVMVESYLAADESTLLSLSSLRELARTAFYIKNSY